MPVKKSQYSIESLLGDDSSFTNMSPDERDYFIQLLQEEIRRREDVGRPEQIRPIVPIETWINSEYYVGPDVHGIYPFWKDFIIDVFREDRKPEEKINQVILGGSIGIGKSCLNKETRVPTSLGLLSLEDLWDRFHNKGQRFQVLSESGIKDCTDVFDNGEAETRILIFKSGRYVECTLKPYFSII